MPNTSGRLFCFGCSMTQYRWPTWADIAGTFWNQYENWGESGAGNQFIFNSVIECDIKNKLTPNDTVAIMWSNPERHDNFIGNHWSHTIKPLNSKNPLSHCLDGYWLTTFSFIYAIDQLLTNRNIPCVMASWVDYTQLESKFHTLFEELISKICYIELSQQANEVVRVENVQPLVEQLYSALSGPDWPSLSSILNKSYSTTPQIEKEIQDFWTHFKNDRRANLTWKTEIDTHPLPSEHLAVAKKIFKDLPWNHDIEHWAKNLDSQIKNVEVIQFDKKLPDKSYYY